MRNRRSWLLNSTSIGRVLSSMVVRVQDLSARRDQFGNPAHCWAFK